MLNDSGNPGMFNRRMRIIVFIAIALAAIIYAALAINTSYNALSTSSSDEPMETESAIAITDAFSIGMNPNRDYLIVVNDQNEYNFDGPYNKALQDDLVYISDVYGEPTPAEKGTILAFTMLQQSLRDQGIEIGLYSGYRTKEDQQAVYDYYGNLEGWAETNKVSEPGFSEHHTGLLLNILIWGKDEEGNMTWMTETPERQAAHPEFAKVHEALADFGFIDRYPSGKEDITGAPCEPYEIRFVGSSEIAHGISDNDLCLEEYINDK